MKKSGILSVIFFLTIIVGVAQEKRSISGKVTDSTTGEVLASVNVFLSNTSIGTSSGADGSFRLQNIPEGKYDLIASSIGYKPYFLSVDLSNSGNGFTQEIKVNIVLEAEVKELNEITIRADTTNWARNYQDFKRLFLGQTKWARSCEIMNPKVLYLYYDTKDDVLVAHAKQPLVIIQKELGYKINYYLYQFEFEARTSRLMVYGVPHFEEIQLDKERLIKKRNRARKQAYQGSLVHFMRSLAQNRLKENGFQMRKVYVVKNKKRPPTEVINQHLKRLNGGKKNMVIRFSEAPSDSLSYYLRLRQQPEEMDSIAPALYTGQEFWNSQTGLFEKIDGRYEVIFNEQEEIEYLPLTGRKTTQKQNSHITFLQPNLKIYRNGYYEDVRAIFLTGYLSWHEKMATFLPLEYEPTSD